MSTDKTRQSGLNRWTEPMAVCGLILVAAGLLAPFVGPDNLTLVVACKWVFAAGALIFTAARVAGACRRDGNFRVRRMRRMEAWAGIAFCIGSFFWFWNTSRTGSDVLTFRMLNETILFTLAGSLIQIVSSWLLSSAMRKEAASADQGSRGEKEK